MFYILLSKFQFKLNNCRANAIRPYWSMVNVETRAFLGPEHEAGLVQIGPLDKRIKNPQGRSSMFNELDHH